ncbi:MAG: hypothetical protein ACYCUG_06100 [Acidimicrobiales bacterium]
MDKHRSKHKVVRGAGELFEQALDAAAAAGYEMRFFVALPTEPVMVAVMVAEGGDDD